MTLGSLGLLSDILGVYQEYGSLMVLWTGGKTRPSFDEGLRTWCRARDSVFTMYDRHGSRQAPGEPRRRALSGGGGQETVEIIIGEDRGIEARDVAGATVRGGKTS